MEARVITLPSHSLPPGYRRVETLSTADVSFLIFVSVSIILAIAAAIYAFIPKQVQQQLFRLKPPHKTLCYQCRYFTHNAYLKCTVHPSTVLTEQAINCLDYSSISKVKWVKED